MFVGQISQRLKEAGRLSLSDLAGMLSADPEAVRDLLGRLEKRGRVRKLGVSGNCGSCCACDPATKEFYEWAGH